MRRSSSKPLILGILVVGAALAAVFVFMFWPRFNIYISFSDLGKIQAGDKLYMNEQVIGEVRSTELSSHRAGKVHVIVENKYGDLLNQSAVFTIANDELIAGRKCLLSKNCVEEAPKINNGHVFQGLGRFGYEVACLEQQVIEFWNDTMNDLVEKAVEETGKLSDEAIERLQELKESNREKLEEVVEQLKDKIKEITPELENQLRDLLKPEENERTRTDARFHLTENPGLGECSKTYLGMSATYVPIDHS